MADPTLRNEPDDIENGITQRNQLGQELAGTQDQTGLAGSPQSPEDSGLVGTPNSPDNSGLAGSSGAPRTDQGVPTDAAYGNDTGYTGNYGAGVGGPGMSGQTRTSESELLDPGYNPQVGDAGRLNDLNRVGQPGTPNYNPDYPSTPGQPTPTGYSGAPGTPDIPDQAGTQDQTTYTNQSGAMPSQDDGGAGMTSNQSGS